MRMYKVRDDGMLDVIVGSLRKRAGKVRSVYTVKAKIIKNANGNPEDIKIDVECKSGEHFSWTAKERKKYGVEDQWTNVLKPVMERAKQLFEAASVVSTESEVLSNKSNRDKFKKKPQNVPSTETVPAPFRAPSRTEQDKDVDFDVDRKIEENKADIQL